MVLIDLEANNEGTQTFLFISVINNNTDSHHFHLHYLF